MRQPVLTNPTKAARINLCREGGGPESRGHVGVAIVRRPCRMQYHRWCVGLWAAIIEAVSIAHGWAQRPNDIKTGARFYLL